MRKFKFLSKNKIFFLPEGPGIYAFRNERELFYIGKAGNIKERVKNHFSQPTYKDNLFLDKIKKLGYIKTDSEIEALILEADLIKKYQPKFNILWRDDKNYFYVAVTKEKYPRVFITHQPLKKLKTTNYKLPTNYIGPFIEGTALKKTLRFLRKVFPFYNTRRHPKNLCPYCHLGLCPGPVPEIKEYKNNIKNLIDFLEGRKKSVLTNLKREMKIAARKENFEIAAKTRDKILSLERVLKNARIFGFLELSECWEKTEKKLKKFLNRKKGISRIEAYDISNIQGESATGSLVVFIGGRPEKNHYRKFKIKSIEKPNDVAMLKEVLKRRLNHLEWPYPDLILIDGGKAQLNAALKVKSQIPNVKTTKILALAKKENRLYIEREKNSILLKKLPREIFNLILQLRDEAHRFAKSYHHKLRDIDFYPKF